MAKSIKYFQEGLDYKTKGMKKGGKIKKAQTGNLITPNEWQYKTAMLMEAQTAKDELTRQQSTYKVPSLKDTISPINYQGNEVNKRVIGNVDVNSLPLHRKQQLIENYNKVKARQGYAPLDIPIQEFGGETIEEGKSGIHINPKNKGKFNALKKKTGKSTEELTHSKNPLTRKRAIFAQNAKHFKHEDGGIIPIEEAELGYNIPKMPTQMASPFNAADRQMPVNTDGSGSNFFKNTGGIGAFAGAANAIGSNQAISGNSQGGPSWSQSAVGSFGPWGALISKASQMGTSVANKNAEKNNTYLNNFAAASFDPAANFTNKDLKKGDRLLAGLSPIYGAIKMKEARRNKHRQQDHLNTLIDQAKNLPGEQSPNKYVRPEDNMVDPNQLYPTYGTGASYLKDGGNVTHAMGGDIKTFWGGKAETSSQNSYLPYSGETIEFKGDSHKNGGIGMTFGNSPVEVEGGEPAVKFKDGGNKENLVVYGNMTIPDYGASEIGDSKAKGKKFKTYVKELNTVENKQNKILGNSAELLNNPVNNAFDKLKFSSAQANTLGANMKLKSIADKKEKAAMVQKAILDVAEERNLDSEELSKGNMKKAKKGTYITKAAPGITINEDPNKATPISKEDVESYKKQGYAFVEGDPTLMKKPGTSQMVRVSVPKGVAGGKSNDLTGYQDTMARYLEQGASYEDLAAKGHGTIQGLKNMFPGYDKNSIKTSTPDDYVRIKDDGTPEVPMHDSPPHPFNSPPTEQTPSSTGKGNWVNYANMVLPYIRPTNQIPLDRTQLAGELTALATNQLEPVRAQQFKPLLKTPYEISLQDQMNANQADYNGIKRLVDKNPAALSVLAGQKYKANSGVLGEQFRINQGMKADVYNQNRDTLNQSQMTNLGILDQQYVRQAQAKSNTKAVNQSAISSIAEKILQNKLENKTLGVYENLYNYRFDKQGRAWNLNAPADINAMFQNAGQNNPQTLDSNGNIVIKEQQNTTDSKGMPIKNRNTIRTVSKNKNGGFVKAANLKSYY